MNKELMQILKDDLYRYYGNTKFPNLFLLKLRNVSLYYSIIFRKAHFYHEHNKKIREWYYQYKLNYLSRKYQIQIPYPVTIGKGLCIVHFGRLIIAPQAKNGDNCNLFTGVTIGTEVRGGRKGAPTIGNSVWIGPNAVIVGKINVGNNVLIAANSYVNFDVPDNSIVIGNPAMIIPNTNATEGYICFKV